MLKAIIVYDGACRLCDAWVKFVLKRDLSQIFQFASFQSAWAKAKGFVLVPDHPGSIALVIELRVFRESDAILEILQRLPNPWPLIATFLHIIPRKIRDLGYRFVARIRYRLFGNFSECPLPDLQFPLFKDRFLE